MAPFNTSCVHLKIDKFPDDAFSRQTLEHGGLTLYLFIALYLFAAMTLVIHAYLISAVHIFADYLHIASYSGRNTIVIPAILLPEFFIALISVFTEKGNISSSTIMGSCAANSLLTLGFVGLVLSKPVKLSWYPLWRDNIFYCVAVTILLWTTYDHQMKWQECMFLFIVYLVYLLLINFNHEVERGVRRIVLMYRTGDDDIEADIEIEKLSMMESRHAGVSSHIGSTPNEVVATYCGCGRRSSSKTKSESLFYDGAIPEEESGELSGEAPDPAIDILSNDRVVSPQEDDYIFSGTDDDNTGCQDFESDPSPFSQIDGVSICSNSRGSLSCASDSRYISSECEPLNRSSSMHRDSTGIYGSCGNVSIGSRDIYRWDEEASTPSTPNKTLSRYARHTQQVFQSQHFIPGSYYLTLDMSHYINGPSSPFSLPDKWYLKMMWILSLPAILCFHFTIPDCRKPKWKKWYPVTLLMSLLWVVALTYVVLWMGVEISYVLKIPDAVIGFTFLATGLSFSKLVTTYYQSKAGYGFKAVYSIYGSNVFNLTVNLGLVWFIAAVVDNPYMLHSGTIVYINLCQLIIVLTPLLLQFTRWRLNKGLAVVYLFLYACFTAIVVLMEYNIIGNFSKPVCA